MNVDRRSLLKLSGGASVIGLSGCVGRFTGGSQTTRLCSVSVSNHDGVFDDGDGDTYGADLQLLDGNEVVAEESDELAPAEGTDPDVLLITAQDVPSVEGVFHAKARVEGGDWVEVTLPTAVDPSGADAVINSNGNLGWFIPNSDQTDCPYIPEDEL